MSSSTNFKRLTITLHSNLHDLYTPSPDPCPRPPFTC